MSKANYSSNKPFLNPKFLTKYFVANPAHMLLQKQNILAPAFLAYK